MQTISGGGAFTRQNISDINSNFGMLFGSITPGKLIYCQPSSSNLGQQDGSAQYPYQSFTTAYGAARPGKNDVVFVVGNGATSGSVRLTANMAFNKDAVHIVGVGAPSYNPRARFSTLSGNTAYAAYATVTAGGCIFSNFSIFNDNAIAAQITWQDQGGRNYYSGVEFGGIGDATSAASTTSRVLKLGGSGAAGENVFENCIIGLDTMPRTVANATLEFAGASKRNVFRNCMFPLIAGATTALTMISSGSNPLETFQLFDNCIFHNPYPQSSALLQAAVATLAASGNGRVIMNNCARYGVTDWGTDATSLGQIYVFGPAVGATDDVGRGSVAIAS